MFRQVLLLALLVLMIPLSFAQPQSKDELKFRAKQATELNKYAEKAYKDDFPGAAKGVWLMLLSEYDPDHANARAKLGYQRSGKTWVKQPGFSYPKADSTNAGKAKSLRSAWEKTEAKVAGNHKKQAQKYEKAGRTDLAAWHWEKVLFFVDDDPEAQAALNHKPVEGWSGTDLEQTLYDRALLIEAVVAEEARKEYEVEVLGEGDPQPFLVKAKVPYVTVKSEHFIVRGDFKIGEEWNIDVLVEAAKNGERALQVMRRIMDGYPGFNDNPDSWITDWVFFQDTETYKQVLRANADLMDAKQLEFRLEHSSGSALVAGNVALDLSGAQNAQAVNDGAVRNVAQAYTNFRAPALREGIGHAIVGRFFNNNRHFIVDREKQQRTTTGEDDPDIISPNMDTWKDLALEQAWKLGEGTAAAQLPLLTADKFPDDARIKSWSFCDYMVLRDPSLLTGMDALRSERQPVEVEAKFTEGHDGLSIAQLEKEWKDFWTGASPVMRQILKKEPPLSALNKDVGKWLTAFNKARMDGQSATAVTWSDRYSGRCAEHVRYLLANPELRGPAAVQMQDISLDGGSHLGDMFAHMAIVDTNAKKASDKHFFERWMGLPGYRDALLSNSLRTVGLYYEDDILVMDVIRGVGTPEKGKGGMRFYPKQDSRIPTEVAVADLGPEIVELLEKHGVAGKEVLGYPLSLHHFGTGGLSGLRDSYSCTVTLRGEPVPGIVHLADGGENRHSSAPGMVVFYALDPLPKGKELKVKWNWENGEGTTTTESFTFDT